MLTSVGYVLLQTGAQKYERAREKVKTRKNLAWIFQPPKFAGSEHKDVLVRSEKGKKVRVNRATNNRKSW